jgi:PPOX class probable F420-dependent enzyme
MKLGGDAEVNVLVADQVMLKRETRSRGGRIEQGIELGWSESAGRPPLTEQLREFLDAHRVGVLATAAPDGRPRQSVVYYARDGDQLLVSTLSARLKARDAQRTDWASLCVRGDEQPYPSATFAGPAEILTKDIGPPTALIMQRIADTDEPPEAQSDEALAAVDPVLLAISVERVSAMSHL